MNLKPIFRYIRNDTRYSPFRTIYERDGTIHHSKEHKKSRIMKIRLESKWSDWNDMRR